MKNLTKDFPLKLKDNLKVGQYSEPRCVVEVDKLAFVPGRIDQLTIEDYKLDTEVEIKREWIEIGEGGVIDGYTVINSEKIIFPVQGMSLAVVTDEFGTPRSYGTHKGIDIGLNVSAFPLKNGVGTPILAAWSGKVSKTDTTTEMNGLGKHIEIIHDGGLKTVYGHLDNVLVNVGDVVEQGQIIAEGGNTGNVLSNRGAVTGKYSDPNSNRSKGYGAHLHFEVHESIDKMGNYRAVNPRPYLEETKKMAKPITQEGGNVIREEPVEGYRNSIILDETFNTRNWHENNVYNFKNTFLKLSTLDYDSKDGLYNWNTLTFNRKFYTFLTGGVSTGMSIKLNMPREGYLDMIVKSNFSAEQGDLFYVTINDPNLQSARIPDFVEDDIQYVNGIYVPQGEVTIDIGIKWGGQDAEKDGKKEPKKFSIGAIMVVEIIPFSDVMQNIYGEKGFSTKQESFSQAQQGYWQEKEIVDFVFTDDSEVFNLSVGDFVYAETITLKHVESCNIQYSLEQDSAEAVVILANPDGIFNPDYNPFYFPDIMGRSPFTSFIGGYQMGVLSNNTPIRIYMGYGNELIRVFTGLIDKVDTVSVPSVMTITARDMYKKISDKVLTETKQYPVANIIENFPGGTPQSDNDFVNEVAPGAMENYTQYGVLPSITIAQAILESGWGNSRIGNNIFGIKAFDDWTGKTVERESPEEIDGVVVSVKSRFRDYDSVTDSIKDHGKLVGTASIYEAVRNATNYRDAAQALQDAGYATDSKYANKLISIIEQNNLTMFDFGGELQSSISILGDDNTESSANCPVLKKGSTGSYVIVLQEKLKSLGFYNGEIDGSFGPATDQAVRDFQSSESLDVDGSVGPQTWGALGVKCKADGSIEEPEVSYKEGFSGEKVAWLKSAVIQDLIAHAGMYGWRQNYEDLQYPDAVIEESYLISINQEEGTYVRAVPGEEGKFETVKLGSVPTPKGWMNPYVDEYGRIFEQYQYRVGECISEVLKDTHYRSYCDRYGTYRLETINYNNPVVDTYTYRENLSMVDKTLDFSRARSHIIVIDENGSRASFLDKEILIELKGEIRTASMVVPWAKSYELKKMVASRLFEDMKRICRTVQVSTPCNPLIDLLDRVRVIDKYTSTNDVYIIKGIRRAYSANTGLIQNLELFWSEKGTVI